MAYILHHRIYSALILEGVINGRFGQFTTVPAVQGIKRE